MCASYQRDRIVEGCDIPGIWAQLEARLGCPSLPEPFSGDPERERVREQTLLYETGKHIQDASFHGQILLPRSLLTEPARRVDYHLRLRTSNFGQMATVYDDDTQVRPQAPSTIPLLSPSWHSLDETACLLVRRSHASWQRSLQSQSRSCGRSFSKISLSRRSDFEQQPCGLTDRAGKLWKVFDIDGTREAARQRALPQTTEQPVPSRRLAEVCAPGYTGRKRGEVVRTRTTVLQAHSYQWLGTFGHAGNREYRKELRRSVEAIQSYLWALFPFLKSFRFLTRSLALQLARGAIRGLC